ncbi:MAG: ArdC-like ssDNA-binding domain-containing protein, partial [Caulobacterales bacterium]
MANALPRAVASSSADHATVPCSPRAPGVRQSERVSVYERITAEIIAAIERGAGNWKMPWHHDGAATHRPLNAATGRPYRGLNVLALWAAAEGSRFA